MHRLPIMKLVVFLVDDNYHCTAYLEGAHLITFKERYEDDSVWAATTSGGDGLFYENIKVIGVYPTNTNFKMLNKHWPASTFVKSLEA